MRLATKQFDACGTPRGEAAVAGRIAVIPARGGSRRIPRKNIKLFGGKPLLAWTIEAALESRCFDRVVVSTEDEEIADISRQYGAEVPFYRPDCFDDESSVSRATELTLAQAEQYWGTEFDQVVQLMANCPLRTSADIAEAVAHFNQHGTPFQISVSRFCGPNPWWALRLNQEHHGVPLFPHALTARSQDLDELYAPTGAIWMAEVEPFRKVRTFYGGNVHFLAMDWRSAVDIDDMRDWQLAEALFLCRGSMNASAV